MKVVGYVPRGKMSLIEFRFEVYNLKEPQAKCSGLFEFIFSLPNNLQNTLNHPDIRKIRKEVIHIKDRDG